MKRILSYIYFIVLFLASIEMFATNWYVDGALTGTDNGGTSWVDAWEDLGEISWASISAGDTIFISGGTTYKMYSDPTGVDSIFVPQCIGTANNYITIIAGKYAPDPTGHNGRVIIKEIWINEFDGTKLADYVRIKGFEITGGQAGYGVKFDCDASTWSKGVIIDSCYIHDYGVGFGIGIFAYTDSAIIQNNRIIDCTSDCGGDRDCIHINEDAGHVPKNIIIRNNFVHSTSQDPTAHNDAFQSVSVDGIYLYNNIIINDSVNSPEGGGMPSILSAVDDDNNDTPPVLVFNNFMFMNGIWYDNANQGWVYELRHDAGTTWGEILPTYIFGNTMVNNGSRNRVFGNGEAYLNLALNNIWASYCPPDAGGNNDWRTGDNVGNRHGWMEVLGLGAVYTTHYMYQDSIRNNLFWREDSTYLTVGGQAAMIVGDGYVYGIGGTGGFDPDDCWDDWIAKGGTGLFRDPKLTTPFGNLSDQGAATPEIDASSPAIDAGEDYTYLVSYLAATYPVIPQDVLDAMLLDYYGNVRGSDGDWDIGAMEFQDGAWTPPDTTATVTFTAVTNAVRNGYYIASGVLSGADSTFHIYTATADSFKVGALGTYNLTVQEADNGDTVFISNIASGSYSTLTTSSIIVSGTTRSFNVTTLAEPVAPDTIPNVFAFVDITNATRSTVYTSSLVTFTGFDSAWCYANGNEYQINGAWVTGYTKVFNNDNARVRLTSSGSYSTATSRTLTVGSRSDTYTVTTESAPVITPKKYAPVRLSDGTILHNNLGMIGVLE